MKDYNNRTQKRKAKKNTLKRKLIILLLAIVTIVSGYVGYVFLEVFQAANDSYNDLGREKSKLREKTVSLSNDPVSVLLMGVDDYSSSGESARTDTLMVATFNPKDKTMKLLSIPRDTLVEIPGEGIEDKINHSYAYGKEELTIETIENFLDIPIDYYVTVNFEGFKNIVNIIGGIKVNVPFDFEQNSDDRIAEKLQFYEGEMTLDGRHALAYARMRKVDPLGDIGRNERQKEVVTAVIDKLTTTGTIFKVDKLTEEIGNNVKTNVKVSETLGFYNKYSDFKTSDIQSLKVEGSDQYINNIYYYIPDETALAELQQELKTHLKQE